MTHAAPYSANRFHRLLGVLTLTFVALGCKSRARVSSLQDRNVPFAKVNLTISVAHREAAGGWDVIYDFTRPVEMLILEPAQSPDTRSISWKIGDSESFELVVSSGNDLVRRKDGKPFQKFSVTVETKPPPRSDSPDVIHFSDGALLLLTRHLSGYLYEKENGSRSLTQLVPTFLLIPARGEFVATGRSSSDKELLFNESARSMGTYVYFGKNRPLTYGDLPFIVDPSIGSGTKTFILEQTAAAYKVYLKELGGLPFEPTFVLYHKDPDDADSASGAATWGQFVINVYGRGQMLDPLAKEVIANAVFHETAHFWNALSYQVRFKPEDKTKLFAELPESSYDTWIFEGGAQALALVSRRGVNYERRIPENLALCKDTIKDKRTIDADSSEDLLWAPYHCGELVQSLAIFLGQRKDANYSAFVLWKAIFTASKDFQYGNATFFEAVKASVPEISENKIKALKRIIVSPAADLDKLVQIVTAN